MKREIDFLKLKGEVKRLEELYLECSICPIDRNCCNTHKTYTVDFSEKEAKVIFGAKIDYFLSKNKLTRQNGGFKMSNMMCPLIDENGYCSIHSQKEILGLKTCMNFPIKIEPNGIISEPTYCNVPLLMVQYRCYAIEKNWELLLKEFLDIERNFGINVYVIYNDIDSLWGVLLSDFELIRKMERIKPQQMYTV
jgi:hypothetical protein